MKTIILHSKILARFEGGQYFPLWIIATCRHCLENRITYSCATTQNGQPAFWFESTEIASFD